MLIYITNTEDIYYSNSTCPTKKSNDLDLLQCAFKQLKRIMQNAILINIVYHLDIPTIFVGIAFFQFFISNRAIFTLW